MLFNDGNALGSRQWAGSSIIDKEGKLHIFYTAAGTKNEQVLSYSQRLVTATADIKTTNDSVMFGNWSKHKLYWKLTEIIIKTKNRLCKEKPLTHSVILTISRIRKQTKNIYCSAQTLPERWPNGIASTNTSDLHTSRNILHRRNRNRINASIGIAKALNGSGLVIGNPKEEPYQAYSWMVMSNGTVISYIDYTDVGGKSIQEIGEQTPEYQIEHFGGKLAPSIKLSIAGDQTSVLHEKHQGVLR